MSSSVGQYIDTLRIMQMLNSTEKETKQGSFVDFKNRKYFQIVQNISLRRKIQHGFS